MNFLHPGLLAFLAAAIAPTLLHRWRQRAAPELPYGAAELLSPPPPPRRRRLSELWLWALRTLAVALAVLLLARPQPPAAAGPPAAALPLAQVVDVSGSMAYRLAAGADGGSLFEAARRLAAADAAEHAARAPSSPSPPAVVVAAGARPVLLTAAGGGGPGEVADALRQLVQEAGGGDLAAAVRRALAALPDGPARLVLYSDLADNALAPLARPRPEEAARWREVHLQLVDAAGRPPQARRLPLPNLAVEAASASPDPLDAAAWRVRVQLRNFAHLAARRVPIQLSADGTLLQQATLDVPAAGAAERTLTQRLEGPRARALTVAIADLGPPGAPGGGLAEDNRLTVLARPPAPLRLMVVAPSPRPPAWADPLGFIEAAAAATPADEPPIPLTAVGPQEAWPLAGPGRPDVVWLTCLGRLGDDRLAELAAFVGAGGGLGVSLGPQDDAEAARPAWAALLARPLRAVRRLQGGGMAAQPVGLALAPAGAGLLRGLDPRVERQLAGSRSHAFFDLEGRAGAATLLNFSAPGGDAPALVAAHRPPAGRLLLWTSSLDCSWSDLALQPAFVPLMQRLLRHLAGRPGGAAPEPVRAGGQLAVVPPAGALEVRLTGPQEARLEARIGAGGRADGGLPAEPSPVRLGPAGAAGLWRAEVRAADGWRRAPELDRSVWPALDESDYRPVDVAALAAAWQLEPPGLAAAGGDGDRGARAGPQAGPRGRSRVGAGRLAALGPLLVATAVLEGLLSAPRRRR